jgi:hypothetical protein
MLMQATKLGQRVRAVFVGLLVASGCSESIPPLIPTTIVVSPIEASLGIGETVQLTAVISDQNGATMPLQATWGTSDPTVASVSVASGLVRGVAAGVAKVSAHYEGLAASISTTVLAPFEIAISGNTSSYYLDDSSQRWRCHFGVTTTATGGRTSDFASWTSGEIQYRYAAGSSSTVALTATDLLDWFGSDRLVSGETKTAYRVGSFSSALSRMDITLRATLPDRSLRSRFVSISCGGAAAITGITLSPASPAVVAFGDSVSVAFDYTTSEPDGVRIWAQPYTAGQFTHGGAYQASGVLPRGGGSMSRYFQLRSGFPEVTVDQVRITMRDGNNTLLLETFVPVNYTFTPGGN